MPPRTIDEYIADAAPAAQPILRRIRRIVKAAVPGATETISYRLPAFKTTGVFLYVAAFTAHIGIFPPVTGSATLQKRLARYRGPKGNLRFPLDEPMPYALITDVVKALAREHARRRARV
jgi:uncharacterized protein YdhG (YjbR/CyaY superfamily)